MPTKKSNIIGLIGTIVIHVLILVIMFCVVIEHSPIKQPEWPPRDSSEILFGGEYVMLGDFNQPITSSNNESPAPSTDATDALSAEDLDNSGLAGEPSQPETSLQESPMQIDKKTTTQQGPTKEELEAKEKARLEQEQKQKIQDQIKATFAGKSNKDNTQSNSNAGQENGNNNVGAINGAPGVSSGGLTLERWVGTSSTKSGTVVVAVTVNPDGKVISAKVKSGTGAAGADVNTRARCEQASLKCSFSVPKNETKVQRGTITWKFK